MTYSTPIVVSPFPLITNFLTYAIERQPLPTITGPLSELERARFIRTGAKPNDADRRVA